MAGEAQCSPNTEDAQMLYQPTKTGKPEFRPARVWASVLSIFGTLMARQADLEYLDGMRPEELEELGLRRTEDRDYRPFI